MRWCVLVGLGLAACGSSPAGGSAGTDGTTSDVTTDDAPPPPQDEDDDEGTSTGELSSGGSSTTMAVTGRDPSSGHASEDSSSGTAVCGEDVEVFEDDRGAICLPERTTQDRIVECLCTYNPPLLEPTLRPIDATDLLYYVNRWYSIDPCFPYTPASSLLQYVRDTYLNAVDDLEPHMLAQCGDYEVELIEVPPGFTNDDDQLLSYAWSSPRPEGYETTLDGSSVGIDGRIGFAPMFAAAADEGIELFVQSGFRSLQTQADLFEYYAGVEGDPALAAVYSAWPAHSEHQLGTTADVGYFEDGQMVSPFAPLESDLHQSPAFVWIRANAHRFGIVTTYGPQRVHVHQYKPEPWHLRFVGVEAADLMHTCELSTEELLAFRYETTALPGFEHMDLVYDAALEGGWDERSCQN